MEKKIYLILTEELKYKPKSAEITCRDLMDIQDAEIQEALNVWVQTREMTHISAEGFDAVSLTDRMYYPSALLAIDMLRREPDRAKQLLKGFR